MFDGQAFDGNTFDIGLTRGAILRTRRRRRQPGYRGEIREFRVIPTRE